MYARSYRRWRAVQEREAPVRGLGLGPHSPPPQRIAFRFLWITIVCARSLVRGSSWAGGSCFASAGLTRWPIAG